MLSKAYLPKADKPPQGLPGQWYPEHFNFSSSKPAPMQTVAEQAFFVPKLISDKDCKQLIQQMRNSGQAAPVGINGYMEGSDLQTGSIRATGWSPELASELWKLFQPYFSHIREMNDYTSTDWYAFNERKEHRRWKAIGVSPLLRFMRYEAGGEHYGHYDMGFDYGDGRRTLVSFVVYLTDVPAGAGGATRLLIDGQEHLPVYERKLEDWERRARETEVIGKVNPQKGGVFFFDHRICHDVELYTGQPPRIIIRGDIVFYALED